MPPNMFVFRLKYNADGNISRFKARPEVRSFLQGFVPNTYGNFADFTVVRVLLCVGVQT